MFKLVCVLLISQMLLACSLFDTETEIEDFSEQVLNNIEVLRVNAAPNELSDISHDEVVEKYQRYLEISENSELRVRTHYRIANLRLQKDEFLWEGGEEGLSIQELGSMEFGRESIVDYERLLLKFPDRNDNDIALYQLAKSYLLAGEPFETIRVLERLVEFYPRSDYFLESLFRLGEVYYANGIYDLAESSYHRLINRGDAQNKYYLSSQYLLGWAQFKQNKYDQSLLSFSAVLDTEFSTENDLLTASRGQQDMLNDILRIMAITFDYQGDWESIASFYQVNGARHYEHLVYSTLATQYYEKKYYKSGASTLRAFVKRYPDDVLAPEFYQRIIVGYQKAGYSTLLRKHKKIFVNTYGVEGAYWNLHGLAVRETIKPVLSTYIWDLARFNHAWGQRIKNKSDKKARLQDAIDWYEEYIRSFPDVQDTAEAHFLLAEVAYQLRQYPLAKDHYEIVAYQYPKYEKASESGYAAILTYSKHKPNKADKAIWRQLTVASAMRFVEEFPEDTRRGQVLVNTSEMLLADKYYEQALKTAMLAKSADGELSSRHQYGAALVSGHASFYLEYYEQAESSILDALQYEKIKARSRKDLREKLAASIYKQGEAAKNAGNYDLAVSNWLRIAVLVPESDIKVSAEFDAATLLMASEKYDQAVPVLLDFRARYPKHRLLKDIPSKLIVAYESQDKWAEAASELQLIWKYGNNKEQQRIALFQSAEYYEKANDLDHALAMYKRYAHDYKRPFDPALEAHFKLDQIYLAQGDDTKRLFWMNKIVWLHLGAKKDQTDRSKYLAAKASYELAENERIKFEKVKITLPLAKSIGKKNKRMQAALERYTQAVKIGVLEYTTSATYRIAELYSQFSRSLLESERPAGLDELALEEYGYLLEDQAFPLEEAAIEVHQTNAGRTFDGLYDQWVRQSFSSLAELMPAQYARFEKQVTYVDAIR
ncbi:MAG: TolA-binding protein [Oleispira sp.]|jgi:TolA-binding protein